MFRGPSPIDNKNPIGSTDISPPPTTAAATATAAAEKDVVPPKPRPLQLLHMDNTSGYAGNVIMSEGLKTAGYEDYEGPYCQGSFVADTAKAEESTQHSHAGRHEQKLKYCCVSVVV